MIVLIAIADIAIVAGVWFIIICNRQFIYQDKEKCMAKGKDTRKEEKKKPTRTLMEKRADKKAKKAGKGS